MKKIAVLCVLFSNSLSFAMDSSKWEVFAGAITIAVSGINPLGVAVGSIELCRGCTGMLYDDLQKGKQYLREQGKKHHWNDQQKRIANEQYKDSFKWLHRAGSPDVFPDVY